MLSIMPRRRIVLRTLGALLATTVAGTCHVAAADESAVLRVAIEGEYPPFSSTAAGGKLKGFDVEIAQALCAAMAASCQLVKQQWDRMIPDLVAGRYEMVVSSMSITPRRRQQIDFTQAYYQMPAKFVARKGRDDLAGSLEALKGKRVGVQKATVHDQFLTANVGGSAVLTRYDTLGKAAGDLQAGRIDYLFGDAMALHENLLKTPKGKAYEFVGPDLRDRRFFGEGIGIAVRKGDDALREPLNAAIKGIRASGTYQEISNRYFGRDIYGPEG